jgi:DNA repair protein RadD
MNALADRWYQEEAVDALFEYFDTHGGTNPDGSPVKANPLLAMPTGTGKSVVIAKFLKRAFEMFPGTRVIMSTHVKELVAQNAKGVLRAWPEAPLGIYSAGLKKKEHDAPIVFGGIQSMRKHPELFGYRDFVIVDEAQLVSPNVDTSYITFFMELMKKNPYLKVIGLSATIYRMRLGYLTNGNIFTDVAFDITDMDGFNRLLAEGYLARLTPRRTDYQLDVSGVGMNADGDFAEGQLQAAIDDTNVTYAALREAVGYGWDRRSWMIFAAGIEHAEHINEMLNNTFGVTSTVIHSKLSAEVRDERLKDFKRGKYRCIVNKDVLTTGFDHPPLDLIIMLRPTMSAPLWVQMLGRGTRPWKGGWLDIDETERAYWPAAKDDCLVLDYAGNTARLGPINDPLIPQPPGKNKGPRDAPVKICPACPTYNHASARNCSNCGYEFSSAYSLQPNLENTASNEELIRADSMPIVEYFDVQRVVYTPHHSMRSGLSSIKVAYFCANAETFFEYVTFEGAKPYAIHKAHEWLRQRHQFADAMIEQMKNYPGYMNEWVRSQSGEFRYPRQIRVWMNPKGRSPEIQGYEF